MTYKITFIVMSDCNLQIRSARDEDAPVLTRIAQAAKQHWGYPEEWMQLWRDDLTLTPEVLAEQTVYCAWDNSIVGFYALSTAPLATSLDAGVPVTTEVELEHMWVDPAHIGRGLGRRLLEHAREQARRRGAHALRIVSDPHAEGFYRKAGAQPVGQVASVPPGRFLPVMRLPLV